MKIKFKKFAIIKISFFFILYNIIFVGCANRFVEGPMDELPFIGTEGFVFPLTYEKVKQTKDLNFKPYNGYWFTPNDTTFFQGCFIDFEDYYFDEECDDTLLLKKRVDRLFYISGKMSKDQYEVFCKECNGIHGKFIEDNTDKNFRRYWRLKRGNLLIILFNKNSKSTYLLMTTHEVSDPEEYIPNYLN